MNDSNSPSPSSPAPSWSITMLLGLALALLTAIVRWSYLAESLWVDELHTAWVVTDSVTDIPQRAAMGNQAALYFYLPWAFTQLAGLHEWSLRFPSFLGGLVAVALVTMTAHRWTHDAGIALASGLVGVIDVDWNFFGTEARVYAVAQAIAILQAIVAWQILQHNQKRDWAYLVGLTVVNFYFHYSTLLFGLCLALAILILANDRATRIRLLVAASCVAALCAISVPHLMTIFQRRENWARFITADNPNEWLRWQTALAVLLPIGIAALLSWWWKRESQPGSEGKRIALVAFVLIVPIVVAWASTAGGVAALFYGRYLISAESTIPLLVAALAAVVSPKWLRAGVLVVAVAIVWQWRMPTVLRSEDWQTITQAVAADIEANQSPTDVVISSGLIETDILLDEAATSPAWETYARLPIESLYALPSHDGNDFGLTYSDAGQPTPRYLAESNPKARIVLLIRGGEAYADQVTATLLQSLPNRQYQIKKPETQTALVQWRVLLPQN
ncbi:glycosyltransferase family 39 protein [Bremerella cremea]|uniref:glycosyltransferase family 39 protein n=1 Tax=Bremerella cremea TaxID=1031537 RepID=UPI0031ED0052